MSARRRSVLSVPGSSPRMLEKAFSLEADELVLDLEDAVAPPAKDHARVAVVAVLERHGDQASRCAVRVNAVRSRWCHRDLLALAEAPVRPASVVVPKVEAPGDIGFVERLLDGVAADRPEPGPIGIQALIESAGGLACAREIATCSPRMASLILGYADLGASLGRRLPGTDPQDARWDAARDTVLVAARAAGIQAIDGPFLGVDVDATFAAAAQRARELGFDGKWAIHPRQVGALNRTFSPTDDEVRRARRIVDALDRAELEEGRGAVAVDGEMLDEAVRRWAADTLAAADPASAVPSERPHRR